MDGVNYSLLLELKRKMAVQLLSPRLREVAPLLHDSVREEHLGWEQLRSKHGEHVVQLGGVLVEWLQQLHCLRLVIVHEVVDPITGIREEFGEPLHRTRIQQVTQQC